MTGSLKFELVDLGALPGVPRRLVAVNVVSEFHVLPILKAHAAPVSRAGLELGTLKCVAKYHCQMTIYSDGDWSIYR